MKKRNLEEIRKEKEKLKAKESFFFYLFLFLLFLVIFSGLKYVYDLKTLKNNLPFYKGKYFLYIYDSKNQEWTTVYEEPFTKKKYIVPFEQHPKEFVNYSVKEEKKLNNLPEYIILVYPKKTNYSYITKASINLGRIFNIKGYYSFYYYWPAYLENNTVEILNKSLKVISKGPLDCNLKKALFVVLIPNSNKNYVLINGSCVFIYGNNSDNFFRGVNKATILFMRKLLYNPVVLRDIYLQNKENNKNNTYENITKKVNKSKQ